MRSGGSFYPTREGNFVPWVANLVSLLGSTPAKFGVTSAIVAPLVDAHDAYTLAYGVAINPATRTKVSVEAKNEARRALIVAMRPVVGMVQKWAGMTNTLRDELRIPRRDPKPTPVPVPTVSPNIVIVSMLGGTVQFKVHSPDDARKSRPEDCFGAMVYWWVGDNVPAALGEWRFLGMTKTVDNQLTVPIGTPAGSKVSLSALYINAKGKPGPACQPVITSVGNVSMSQAA